MIRLTTNHDVWLALVIIALACWRISSLLVYEDGPFDVLAKFRSFIGVYYDEMSVSRGKNVFASALTCLWCTSPYIAIFLVGGWIVFPKEAILVYLPFTVSAIAIMIEANVSKIRDE